MQTAEQLAIQLEQEFNEIKEARRKARNKRKAMQRKLRLKK